MQTIFKFLCLLIDASALEIMKKVLLCLATLVLAQCVYADNGNSGQRQRPVDYVNMFIGSDGADATEYGGTTPAVSEPFGMTQWCAATRVNGISRTMYHSGDSCLLGFMGTHQPAIWMGDYGFMTLMPQSGELKIAAEDRMSKINRDSEIATPYYYRTSYTDMQGNVIDTELTATSRCSFFRIHYDKNQKAVLYLEAGREKEGGGIEIFPERREVWIYNKERHDRHLGPQLNNFKGYYVLKFSQDFASYGTCNNQIATKGKVREEGPCVGGYVEFGPATETVTVRIGSSFIDYAQAEINLQKEMPDTDTFDSVKERVRSVWDSQLGRVSIKGASDDDLQIFYTAFFRTLQYPREFSEYGKYYSPFDEKIHKGVSYNSYSLWDTFRAQHPWLQLVQPERVSGMVAGLVQMYRECGWIPKWPNPTFTSIMIGTHADAVIADAYVNGFRDYDLETAYQAIRKNAFTAPWGESRWGDRQLWNGSYEARGGLDNYLKLGYVASDKTYESVSRTLEFALDDYCIAQMAKGLGKSEDYKVLMEHSQNYRNLFDESTGFFRARRSDGSWGGADEGFTEGGRWTYRFCVMQDVPGLIELLGGESGFCDALDRTFDEGHYRHDNEPGHHFVYLYDHCNRLDKAQERIPDIIRKHYQNRPDGLSGNDDCGQMSAWYLFSSLGFYPLTSASGEYALGIPHFKEITVSLAGGKQLTIKAPELGEKVVLPKVRWNGVLLDRPFVPVREIFNGGVLEFSSR